jgi:hypothetical protein
MQTSLYPTYSCIKGHPDGRASGPDQTAACASCPNGVPQTEHGVRVARAFDARLCDATYDASGDATYVATHVARTRKANQLRFGCPRRPEPDTRTACPLGAGPDEASQDHTPAKDAFTDHVGAFRYRPRSRAHNWNGVPSLTWHRHSPRRGGRGTRRRGTAGIGLGRPRPSFRRPVW